MRDRNRLLTLASELQALVNEIETITRQGREWLATRSSNPDIYDLRAAGSILHDFYTALEDGFELIAQVINGGCPRGEDWHRRLLQSMALDVPGVRPPLLTRELVQELDEYLRFRHVFRNVYGHHLEWERIAPLMQNLAQVSIRTCRAVERFGKFLTRLAGELDES
ncbi:MAG: hypothetical protein HPY90_15390 [Syntrophothermus sp.]|uniref:ribonuclease toxin HepT-like protein n=1 Tax=Syntrophothermus sp. TaxID=2736299 RepID=UPI00257DFDBA|nr:hypothetical protein [Syntrophothermus sp.]NSW84583.1 hypothetical protein [Syntrophothermus sp.]